MDLQLELAQAFEGHELDVVDQLTQLAAQVFTIIALDGQMEVLGKTAIAVRSAGVQLHHDRIRGYRDDRLQLVAAFGQRFGARLQVVHGDHLLHEHQLGAFQPAPDLREFALGGGPLGQGPPTAVVHLLADDVNGRSDGVGGEQMGLDAREDALLHRLRGDDLAVGAGAALPVGAAGVFGAVQGHAAPAGATLHQARQQPFRPAGMGGRLVAQRGLAGLHCLPRQVVDDAQVGDRFAQPGLTRIQNRRPATRIGVLAIVVPVEHSHADVELLVQDAVAGAAVAVDGRWGPLAAARPGLAGGVKAVGDSAGRTAGTVLFIYMADDVGLMIVDLKHALGDDPVAIAATAAGEAGLDPGNQAATGLLAELDQEHLVHRPGQADVQLGDATLGQGLERDPVIGQALIDVRGAFLIAGDAVKRFGHDHVDLAAGHSRH